MDVPELVGPLQVSTKPVSCTTARWAHHGHKPTHGHELMMPQLEVKVRKQVLRRAKKVAAGMADRCGRSPGKREQDLVKQAAAGCHDTIECPA